MLRGPELHRRSSGYAYPLRFSSLQHFLEFQKKVLDLWSGLCLHPSRTLPGMGVCRLVSTPSPILPTASGCKIECPHESARKGPRFARDAQFCNCLEQTKLALGSALSLRKEDFSEFDRYSIQRFRRTSPTEPDEVLLLHPAIC